MLLKFFIIIYKTNSIFKNIIGKLNYSRSTHGERN